MNTSPAFAKSFLGFKFFLLISLFIKLSDQKSNVLESLNLTPKNYILVTAHRSLNVDHKARLSNLILSLQNIIKNFEMPVVYPIHPRTKKMLDIFNIDTGDINFKVLNYIL